MLGKTIVLIIGASTVALLTGCAAGTVESRPDDSWSRLRSDRESRVQESRLSAASRAEATSGDARTSRADASRPSSSTGTARSHLEHRTHLLVEHRTHTH